MPFASEAQRRAMYAAAHGRSKVGIDKKGAQKFINDSVKHSTGTKSKLKDEMRRRKEKK